MGSEIRIDRSAAAAGGPGWLPLGGRAVAVRHPVPADFFALRDYARGLAKAKAKTPLQAVGEELDRLPEEMRAAVIREAVAQSKGLAAVEPTEDMIGAESDSYEAAVWYAVWLARDAHPDLAEADVRSAYPPADSHRLKAALLAATKLEDTTDPGKGRTSSASG